MNLRIFSYPLVYGALINATLKMLRTKHLLAANRILSLLTIMLLTSCATGVSKDEWPSDMPARNIFVKTYHEQYAAGTNDNSLENHLKWVKRFYQGSIIYPIGWNQMTESVLASVDSISRKIGIRPRLRELGLKICIEWAQKNDVRKINSSAVAAWGNALRTAAVNNQQELFISRVEADVAALLDGKLDTAQITRERYYPAEDYDNF